MKKKVEITVSQARPITRYFNRVREVFERKFDGYPASVAAPTITEAAESDAALTGEQIQEIIDEITGSIPTENIPPCPDVPIGDCATGEGAGSACAYDNFNRADTVSGWGTAPTGQVWEAETGFANGPERIEDNVGILHETAGYSAGTTVVSESVSAMLPTPECVVPIDMTFRFWYEGIWNCSYPHNRVPSNFADPNNSYWAPGFSADPEQRTNSNGELDAVYVRAFLRVSFKQTTSPMQIINIYNSAGSIWLARWTANTVSGHQGPGLPTEIGPWLQEGEVLNVRLRADSDRNYIRVWKESETEPTFWQLETAATGSNYDYAPQINHTTSARNATLLPFTLYIDDFGLGDLSVDCSGQSVFEALSPSGGGYETSMPANYFISVWFDGMIAINGVDYTTSGNIVTPTTALDPGTVVTARYVVA